MPIPPHGWGAVESLVWDYHNILTEEGHEVHIINTPNRKQIIEECNNGHWDFIHVHYDQFYDIIPHIRNRKIGITSHYPYVDQLEKHESDNYNHIFYFLTRNSGEFYLFCDSEKDKKAFLDAGANPEYLKLSKLGVNFDNWDFKKECKKENKSAYLGKIEPRKRQYLFQSIKDIDFIGKHADHRFDKSIENYLGEIKPRSKLFESLTDYANMALLSVGENCTSLAIKEGMACGLGAVVSEYACTELNLSLPYVDVIKEDKINDLEYVSEVIKNNREISIQHREEIRDYALGAFSWKSLIKDYIANVEELTNK